MFYKRNLPGGNMISINLTPEEEELARKLATESGMSVEELLARLALKGLKELDESRHSQFLPSKGERKAGHYRVRCNSKRCFEKNPRSKERDQEF